MANVNTKKPWGVACTINTATAAAALNVVYPKGTAVRIGAIVLGGAATTDRITITEADGTMVYRGCALVGQTDKITFPTTVYLDGMCVGFAGATTGFCNIFFSNR